MNKKKSYITTLFNNNDKPLERHFENMKIICKGYKGIYLYECGNNSKEECIITLFWDKIKELPIAQNVLITNKETSLEEIQAFFIELFYVIICCRIKRFFFRLSTK